MTYRMIRQLWNTNTQVIVSRDADLTENSMYISMKFGTGVRVFCWEVGVFNRSGFRSVSCKPTVVILDTPIEERERKIPIDLGGPKVKVILTFSIYI